MALRVRAFKAFMVAKRCGDCGVEEIMALAEEVSAILMMHVRGERENIRHFLWMSFYSAWWHFIGIFVILRQFCDFLMHY